MTSSTPIALSHNQSSSFNDMARSPPSWCAGSFGSRFYPTGSPSQFQLDPNDFKCAKMSSSVDSDRGSIFHALNSFEREGEHCKNYSCCGLNLTDLHALLEHFEQVHIVVVDPQAPHNPFAYPPTLFSALPTNGPTPTQAPQPTHHSYLPQHPTGPFDPDDMELELDPSVTPNPHHHSPRAPSSGAPTPPDTPISTPLISYPSAPFYNQTSAPPPSPTSPAPISAFETTTVLRPSLPRTLSAFPRPSHPPLPPDAFNAYAGYSDYSSSMPGTVPSPTTSAPDSSTILTHTPEPRDCVPPALLYSSAGPTPANTPSTSRVPSPSLHQNITATATSIPTRPSSSLLLSKPFRCPKPNCNKSYKQANGLKYHITHGSCNFAPPKDLEQVQALLASKRLLHSQNQVSAVQSHPNTPSRPNSGCSTPDPGISEGELREVEREAERRLRPFACGIGDCQRRYKNMNGLRYHYQHSGDHGAVGIALLASGQHGCLSGGGSRVAGGSNVVSRAGTPALGGQQQQQQQPQAQAQQQAQQQVQVQHVYLAQQQHAAQMAYQQQQQYQQHQAYMGMNMQMHMNMNAGGDLSLQQ